MPDVSVVIPFKGGDPHRDAALALTLKQWPDSYEVIVSEGEGDFNKGRLVAAGVEKATSDVVCMADGDLLFAPGAVEAAVAALRAGSGWAQPFHIVHRLNEAGTATVLEGLDPYTSPGMMKWPSDALLEKPRKSVEAGGCVVMTREHWLDVPISTQFVKWGGEDSAHSAALEMIIGPPKRIPGVAFHLWHTPQERVGRYRLHPENGILVRLFQQAARRRDKIGMLELVAAGGGRLAVPVRPPKRERVRVQEAGMGGRQLDRDIKAGRVQPYESGPMVLAVPPDGDEDALWAWSFPGPVDSRHASVL